MHVRAGPQGRLVGLKGYVTNIPAGIMDPDEVIASYHDLWRVEQSFRMSNLSWVNRVSALGRGWRVR